METRKKDVHVRLSEDEFEKLNKKVDESGLSREVFIRNLIENVKMKEKPPLEFFETIQLLRICGDNINQIAKKANMTGRIDAAMYKENFDKLQSWIDKLFEEYF